MSWRTRFLPSVVNEFKTKESAWYRVLTILIAEVGTDHPSYFIRDRQYLCIIHDIHFFMSHIHDTHYFSLVSMRRNVYVWYQWCAKLCLDLWYSMPSFQDGHFLCRVSMIHIFVRYTSYAIFYAWYPRCAIFWLVY